MYCWSEATRSKMDAVFADMGINDNADKITMLCAAPEVFGIHPLQFTMEAWILHYMSVEIAKRLKTDYLGGIPIWSQHIAKCLRRYPWQGFQEKPLVLDFLREYHEMLEVMDEKARIITGLSMVRGYK